MMLGSSYLIYTFDSGPMQLQLKNELVFSNVTSVCPDYYFMMQASPSGAFDSQVFTLEDGSNMLIVETKNYKKLGVYPLLLNVRYIGDQSWYTRLGQLAFTIEI